MSKTREMINRLQDVLIEELETGFDVSAETLFFLESTYNIMSHELEAVLADTEFEERETIVQVIFPPSFSLRETAEEILHEAEFTAEDKEMIVNGLVCGVKQIVLVLPDGSHLSCPADEDVCRLLVNKLYLTRIQDREIVSALREHLPSELMIKVLVSMRCKDIRLAGQARQFFLLFVENAASRGDLTVELFLFLLAILAVVPADAKVDQYLLDRRKQARKVLQDISEFQEKIKKYGMEYLLMQKYPVPHESEEDVEKDLRVLDIIIEDIMVIRDPAQAYVGNRDLGHFDKEDDLKKLFRTLS